MNSMTRVGTLLVGVIVTLTACSRRRAEPEPPPAVNADSATLADAAARAREDSIAAANRAREDSIAAANGDRERRLGEARSAVTAAIYFDYDRAEITDQARTTLDAKLPILTANSGLRIRIAGHTDSRGSDEYNLALGQRRAAAAKRYLVGLGVGADRIEVISYGEERPAAQGEDESAYAQNRRDEFEITAGGDNLQLPQS